MRRRLVVVNMATKKVTYSLVIYEEIPERTTLVLVPDADLDENDRVKLMVAQGVVINATDSTENELNAANCVSDALTTKVEYLSEQNPKGSKWAMRFEKYTKSTGSRSEMMAFQDVMITHVYWCGFAL